jgi:cytochrome c1
MNGNPHRGRQLIVSYGCGACHVIPGIYTARGLVGPPLYFFSRRTIIAGELPNTPDNLVRWLRHPTAVEPGTAMPDLGLNQQQAQDIAAYLYTLE